MPPQLADHGRHGEGCEVAATVGVEPIDRLEQADRTDLDGIFQLLTPEAVAAREPPYEWEVETDELLARCEISPLSVCAK